MYEIHSVKCNGMKSEGEDETQAKDPVETHELVDKRLDMAHGYLAKKSYVNKPFYVFVIVFIAL